MTALYLEFGLAGLALLLTAAAVVVRRESPRRAAARARSSATRLDRTGATPRR